MKRLDLNIPEPTTKKPFKLKSIRRVLLVLGIVTILFFISIIWTTAKLSPATFNFAVAVAPIKSTDGRVNVLLLGLAGGKHDGPDLTDSIIIASYNIKTKKSILFSIPRDLWLEGIKQKINAAYEIGKSKGIGLIFAEDKIDDILGMPIHYGLKLDFAGFAKAIDTVEGVDVEVSKTFDDWEYPITNKENELCGNSEQEIELNEDQAKAMNLTTGKHKLIVTPTGKVASESADFACRFEHLHFDKGLLHLNGEEALKFVRSRHGTSGEGSDFARSKRQQLVMESFRSKVISLPTLINPHKIAELVDAFQQSFETDIPKEKFLDFYTLSKSMTKSESVVLGDLGGGNTLFINPPSSEYYGAWVLVPKDKDFSKIAQFIKETIQKQDAEIDNPQ